MGASHIYLHIVEKDTFSMIKMLVLCTLFIEYIG